MSATPFEILIAKANAEHAAIERVVAAKMKQTGYGEAVVTGWAVELWEIAGTWRDLPIPYKQELIRILDRKIAKMNRRAA